MRAGGIGADAAAGGAANVSRTTFSFFACATDAGAAAAVAAAVGVGRLEEYQDPTEAIRLKSLIALTAGQELDTADVEVAEYTGVRICTGSVHAAGGATDCNMGDL